MASDAREVSFGQKVTVEFSRSGERLVLRLRLHVGQSPVEEMPPLALTEEAERELTSLRPGPYGQSVVLRSPEMSKALHLRMFAHRLYLTYGKVTASAPERKVLEAIASLRRAK